MHSILLMKAGMLLLDRLYIVHHSILCVCRCLALHASSAAAIFSAFMTPSQRHCQSVLLLTPPYLAQANAHVQPVLHTLSTFQRRHALPGGMLCLHLVALALQQHWLLC